MWWARWSPGGLPGIIRTMSWMQKGCPFSGWSWWLPPTLQSLWAGRVSSGKCRGLLLFHTCWRPTQPFFFEVQFAGITLDTHQKEENFPTPSMPWRSYRGPPDPQPQAPSVRLQEAGKIFPNSPAQGLLHDLLSLMFHRVVKKTQFHTGSKMQASYPHQLPPVFSLMLLCLKPIWRFPVLWQGS